MKYKIDVISQICVFVDYPLYRANLTKHRDKFQQIILYPSRHHGVVDLESFLRERFPETWVTGHVIDWSTPGIDWRQAETEPCVALSSADWILFLEQDFFCDDWDKLFKDVEEQMDNGADLIGWWNETHFPYIHPCFLLIKRELLNKTKQDYSAHPEINGGDHFAMVTHDAQELGAKIIKLQDLGWTDPGHAFHLGGLTYPYQNFNGDETIIGVKYPEAFAVYNYWSRRAPIAQSQDYYDLSVEIGKVLEKKFPNLDFYNNEWEKFFKV